MTLCPGHDFDQGDSVESFDEVLDFHAASFDVFLVFVAVLAQKPITKYFGYKST